MTESTVKMGMSAVLAAIFAYFQLLAIPLILVAFAMFIDYISGVAAASVTKDLSSRVGIIGIIKKVCYGLIAVVGIIIDLTVQYAAGKVGLSAGNFHYFALLVCVWLIVNECISILENIARAGVGHPKFLDKILLKLRATAEKKGVELADGGNRDE